MVFCFDYLYRGIKVHDDRSRKARSDFTGNDYGGGKRPLHLDGWAFTSNIDITDMLTGCI